MLLKYAKVRDVKDPCRGHYTDAGIDFFVPVWTEKFDFDLKLKNKNSNVISDLKQIILKPNTSVLIPSGIIVEIDYSTMGLFLNKSGIAVKKSLIIGAQVIDTFYDGEVHINLHNIGEGTIIINQNDKIAQMVIVPINIPKPIQVKKEEIYSGMRMNKLRESSGFGSTGE